MQHFTRQDLARYDGRNGSPAYVAFDGKVYDVTGSYFWRNGVHQVLHPAGRDLTAGMRDAPHGPDMLAKFKIVGWYVP
jgi:predicted heme/steroid binding protein